MKKTLCILAVLLVIAGGVLMLATFPTMLSEYRRNDSYTAYSENLKTSYDSIEISTINANLTVTNTADGIPAVDAETDPAFRVNIESKDGKLMIEEVDLRKWYQKIGIFSPKPGKIEVRLADGIYPSLIANSANGDINIKADLQTIAFETIIAEATNGDSYVHIPVDMVTVKSVNGNISFVIGHGSDPVTGLGQTGAVFGMTINGNIIDVSFAQIKSLTSGNGSIHTSGANTGMVKLYVKTTNGDIELDRIYGQDIRVESVNGDVTASLWRPMTCTATTKNGRVKIPEEGGEYSIEISTVNGDITVELAN